MLHIFNGYIIFLSKMADSTKKLKIRYNQLKKTKKQKKETKFISKLSLHPWFSELESRNRQLLSDKSDHMDWGIRCIQSHTSSREVHIFGTFLAYDSLEPKKLTSFHLHLYLLSIQLYRVSHSSQSFVDIRPWTVYICMVKRQVQLYWTP